MVIMTLYKEEQIQLGSDAQPLVKDSEDFDNEVVIEEETKLDEKCESQSYNTLNGYLYFVDNVCKVFNWPCNAFKNVFKLQTLANRDYIVVI